MGTDQVRMALQKGETPESLLAGWEKELALYREKREKYLMYR
jgi:hypothetical protein